MLYFARCATFPLPLSAGIMPERELSFKSLRALDPQALSAVHNRYYADVRRFAVYRLGDEMTAEDLASETFIRLIDALRYGKGPRKNIRGWLLGTLNNLINDHYRKHYRDAPEVGLDPEASQDSLSEVDARLDTQNQLTGALAALTDEQQMVISLRFGAEMSLAETAAAMGKKANAIKALQFRAIAALRQELGAESDD